MSKLGNGDLGQLIAARRKELGLSQADLANKVGIYYKFIYELEVNRQSFTLHQLEKVLDALDLEIDFKPKAGSEAKSEPQPEPKPKATVVSKKPTKKPSTDTQK